MVYLPLFVRTLLGIAAETDELTAIVSVVLQNICGGFFRNHVQYLLDGFGGPWLWRPGPFLLPSCFRKHPVERIQRLLNSASFVPLA